MLNPLGVDSSVKVVYKPVRRFREEGGLISKTVTYTYKQVTEINNTRNEPAVITFIDQLPKSQDEKLKVRTYIWQNTPTVYYIKEIVSCVQLILWPYNHNISIIQWPG